MSKSWAKGSTRTWRRIRAQVLLANQINNNGMCNLNLWGCTGIADSVDHIYGRSVTGDDINYLQAVCGHCNSKKGSPLTQPDPLSNPLDRW